MPKLKAFDDSKAPLVRLQAEVKRRDGRIELAYRFEGALSTLLRAPKKDAPAFTDELWKTTCFEVFLQVEGQEGYDEWNFSPSGDWAHYRFTSYRQRMDLDTGDGPLSFDLQVSQNELRLLTQIRDSFVGKNLRFTATAVLHTTPDQKSYWAMEHARPQPDFHAPESFVGRI